MNLVALLHLASGCASVDERAPRPSVHTGSGAESADPTVAPSPTGDTGTPLHTGHTGVVGTTADTGAHTGLPPGPSDVALGWLAVPTRGMSPPNASDHEVDSAVEKIVFTDTVTEGPDTGTWVWVASLTGEGDWSSAEPLALLSPRGDAVPLSGQDQVFGAFPNTAEWSRTRGGASRVYWSAYTEGPASPAALQWNELDPRTGFAVEPTPMAFAENFVDHRYLVNASWSDAELDDRYLVYVRQEYLTRRPRWSWCLDRPGERSWDEPLIEPHTPPTGRSFTVRPIPDAYAVFMATEPEGRQDEIDLVWYDLVPSHPEPAGGPRDVEPVVLHTYRDASRLTLLGVGAIRAPLHDGPDRRAYVMYAVVRGRDLLGRVTTWYDSFLVHYRAPSGVPLGPIDDPGRVYANRATVTVAYGRRMVPDANLVAPYAYLLDDENYVGVDQRPYVVAVMTPDWGAGRDTQLWVYDALGDDPGTPYVVDEAPPTDTPTTQLRISEGGVRKVLDPQPGVLLDTSVVPPEPRAHVFYREEVELVPGLSPTRNQFWRATP